MAGRSIDPRFGARLRTLIQQRGVSYRSLAARTHYGKSYLHDLAMGRKSPSVEVVKRLDDVLGAAGQLVALVSEQPVGFDDDELDALELARRVAASDVSLDTLTRLDAAFDDLATAYAATAPTELLPRVRRCLACVARLVDARKTLAQQRQLLVIGGWLSLLAATVHIDLRQTSAARARLATAAQLARHADHSEIHAWCLETEAWQALTSGNYRQAVELSRHAQRIAPPGGSVYIQSTAQEGRAWARMGRQTETRDSLNRVSRLVASLPVPHRPEHHYRYDPDKSLAYTATTLAWAGDPAAEEHARMVIAHLETASSGILRPRRVASARLDLGLALLASNKPDEAAAAATAAVTSGRIVASNWWRATEILTRVERCGISEAVELRDAYETYRP